MSALRTFDDVAIVCLAHELERVTGELVHPHAWMSPPEAGVAIAVAVSAIGNHMTGIQVQFLDVETEQTQALVTVQPYSPGSAEQLGSAITIAWELMPAPEEE